MILNTINKKLLVFTIAFAVVLLCGMGATIAQKSQSEMQSLMQSKGNAIVSIVSKVGADHISNFDLLALEDLTTLISEDEEISYQEQLM